jgi:hypothetical protein
MDITHSFLDGSLILFYLLGLQYLGTALITLRSVYPQANLKLFLYPCSFIRFSCHSEERMFHGKWAREYALRSVCWI